MGNLSVDNAVVVVVRDWIRAQERAGLNGGQIAKLLKCTRTSIVNMRDTSRGVGPKIEQNFADLLYGSDVGALRRAAKGEAESVATVASAGLERFNLSPKERRTVDYAIQCENISLEAIVEALSTFYKGAGSLDGPDMLDIFRISQRQIAWSQQQSQHKV